MASRPDVHGEWSQAGIMFTMAGGSRWFCTTPEEDWPLAEMEGAKEAIKQDFYGKWGDRESLKVCQGLGSIAHQIALSQAVKSVSLSQLEVQCARSTRRGYRHDPIFLFSCLHRTGT